MIEIIYKEEKQEARGNESYFRLPKNIRQIGDCKGKQKIYLEDYVYTYLKKLSADASAGKAAILLGQYNWADGIAYFFLRGALEITSVEVSPDNLKLDEKVWKEVEDTKNRYFRDQSILGWFLSLPGELEENDERILKTHLNHFGGNDKVLFRMEPNEKEEAFYIYDNGALKKLGGFYIYYEKNEAMQNYMIDHNHNARVEDVDQVADQAVSDFRKIVGQRQEQQKKKSGNRVLAYGITVCAAAAALALGMNYLSRNPGILGGRDVQTDSSAVAANGRITASGQKEGEAAGDGQQKTQTENGSSRAVSETGQNTDGTENDETEENAGGGADGSSDTSDDALSGGETGENVSDSGETAKDGEGGQAVSGTETSGETSGGAPAGTSEETTAGTSAGTGAAAETSAGILTEYTVQKGDSLSRISEKYYGTMSRVKDICAMNGITSEDVIYAGQKILLPK